MAGDDAEEDGEVIRLEAEQAALDRAKERISLKHKNTRRGQAVCRGCS